MKPNQLHLIMANLVPREQIEMGLMEKGLSKTDIRYLLRKPEFTGCQTRNQQVLFLDEFCKKEFNITFTNKDLGDIFNVSYGTIANIRKNSKKPKKPIGAPRLVEQDEEDFIISYINCLSSNNVYMTEKELRIFANQTSNRNLSRGWVKYFLIRNKEKIGITLGIPQENARLEVPRTFLEQHIENIKKYVIGKASELVFNLDEMGSNEWEEKKPKKVIVPVKLCQSNVHLPIKRTLRHQTLLACISATGDSLTPHFIVSSNSAKQVFQLGIREGIDLNITTNTSPYVNEEIFHTYIEKTLIPYVNNQRRIEGFEKEFGVLFMDNCMAHCSERSLKLLAENSIIVISFPPHTSNLFQMLDLVLFGCVKNIKRGIERRKDLNPAAEILERTFRAYEQASTSSNCRSCFERAGMSSEDVNGMLRIKFNEDYVRKAPNFAEIWNIDFKETNLSKRRANSKWGFINKEYFPEGTFE